MEHAQHGLGDREQVLGGQRGEQLAAVATQGRGAAGHGHAEGAAPRLTPSRIPLLNQRWSALPAGIPVRELAPDFPGGPQFGARWNHIGRSAEYSLSFYNGYDHLPLFRVRPGPAGFDAQRFYPRMRMYGGDLAAPLPVVTLKAEAAYFTSSTRESDEYALYVLQLERQAGEWFLVGGYAGQVVTRRGATAGFSPVRGFTRSFVGRAGYTIDVNRSIAIETVVRQNGRGLWLKPEYTQAFGQHCFSLLRGRQETCHMPSIKMTIN
jgi:hypothetical protein